LLKLKKNPGGEGVGEGATGVLVFVGEGATGVLVLVDVELVGKGVTGVLVLVDVALVGVGVTGVLVLVGVEMVGVGVTGVLVLVGVEVVLGEGEGGALAWLFWFVGCWGKLAKLMKLVKLGPEGAVGGKLLMLKKKSPAGLAGAGTGVLVVFDVELVGVGATGIGVGVGGLNGLINCERFCNRREPLRPTMLSFLLPKLKRIVATKVAARRILIHADTFVILIMAFEERIVSASHYSRVRGTS
jgi:hypothetical protein